MKIGLQLRVEVEWRHGIRLSVLPGSRAGRVSPRAARGAILRSEIWQFSPFLESCFWHFSGILHTAAPFRNPGRPNLPRRLGPGHGGANRGGFPGGAPPPGGPPPERMLKTLLMEGHGMTAGLLAMSPG